MFMMPLGIIPFWITGLPSLRLLFWIAASLDWYWRTPHIPIPSRPRGSTGCCALFKKPDSGAAAAPADPLVAAHVGPDLAELSQGLYPFDDTSDPVPHS